MSLRSRFMGALFPFVCSKKAARTNSGNRRVATSRRFELLEPRWTMDGDAVDSGLSPGGVQLSIGDAEIKEWAGYAIVKVSCSPHDEVVSVDYGTIDDCAQAGSDFESASGTLVFESGVTELSITIGIINDTSEEGAEPFFVELSNAAGASILDAQGIVTIDSSDHAPSIDSFIITPNLFANWTISGSVSDADESCEGFVIHFGGVLAGYNLSATVQSDGTFSVTADLFGLLSGSATAQTTDSEGLDSNLAIYVIA